MAITIGIAGITGKFGGLLATHLLKNSNVELRGFCRTPSKLPETLRASPQLKIFEGGAFDTDAVAPFAKGCDVVVCAYLGSNQLMVDGQKILIDACEKEKIPRYISSDWSIDYTKLELGQLFPKDPMIEVKAYVETKKNTKGVHILIGGFMNTLFSPFFGLWDAKSTTIRYWGNGTEGFEASTYDNAAEYTAAIAVDANATGIQRFVADKKSAPEIAEIIEKTHGAKPKLERLGPLEELYEKMTALRAQFPNEVFKYMALYYTYYMLSGKVDIGPDYDNSRYPQIKPVTWEDFIKSQTP